MSSKAAARRQGSEYAVYTFGIPEQDNVHSRMWEKKASHAAVDAAVRQAEDLFRTGQYRKIEIKQKYFDRRRNRNVDLTLKTLGQKENRRLRTAVAVALAMASGALAFAVTYFIGYGG